MWRVFDAGQKFFLYHTPYNANQAKIALPCTAAKFGGSGDSPYLPPLPVWPFTYQDASSGQNRIQEVMELILFNIGHM